MGNLQVKKFDKMETLKQRNKLYLVRYKVAIGTDIYLQTIYLYQSNLFNAVKQFRDIAVNHASLEIVYIEELAEVQF